MVSELKSQSTQGYNPQKVEVPTWLHGPTGALFPRFLPPWRVPGRCARAQRTAAFADHGLATRHAGTLLQLRLGTTWYAARRERA